MDYLSNKTFTCLKGYFALCIIVHHIYQFSEILSGTAFSFILLNLGYWAVAMFMFMSGFGLYESYRNKGFSYINSFPRNRLLSFYMMYTIVAIVYILFDIIMKSSHTVLDYIKTFTFGSTIISFGWYLQLNFALYIVFWMVFRFIKKPFFRVLAFAFVFVAYSVAYFIIGMPDSLYTPVFMFAFGMIWAIYKESFEKVLNRFWILIAILSFVIFGAGYFILWHYQIEGIFVPLIRVISGISFCNCVMITVRILMKCMPKVVCNAFSRFMGKISLETYICQGLVLRGLYPLITNKYLYAIVSLIAIIGLAIPVQMLVEKMNRAIKKN